MKTIEKTQIRTNKDGLVVFMSDWTRWIEFVEKGYFARLDRVSLNELINDEGPICGDAVFESWFKDGIEAYESTQNCKVEVKEL